MDTASLLFVIKTFILPPGINILVFILGYLLLKKHLFLGKLLIVCSILSLYLLSTTYISHELARVVETEKPLPTILSADTDRQAIVLLGGGRYVSMPEYGQPLPYANVLERIRYAVRIQRQTDLPILVTGGSVFLKTEPEATIINRVLAEDFQLSAKWLETESKNTAENARYSYEILNKENIHKIYLVTHASHMKRAASIFKTAGFDVTPAPTIFYSAGMNSPIFTKLLPESDSLLLSRNMLHEMLGYWWYQYRYAQ